MAQWAKYLLDQHDDLSSYPQKPWKTGHSIVSLGIFKTRWKAESGDALETGWPAVLEHTVSGTQKGRKKKKKIDVVVHSFREAEASPSL